MTEFLGILQVSKFYHLVDVGTSTSLADYNDGSINIIELL